VNHTLALLTALLLAPLATLHADESVELKSGRFCLALRDGRTSVRSFPSGEELLNQQGLSGGFYLQHLDGKKTPLNNISPTAGGRFTARTADGRQSVVFGTLSRDRYLALQVEKLVGIPAESCVSLHLELNADARLRVTELDYMTRVQNERYGVRAHWSDLCRGAAGDPLGGVALYVRQDDADEDETLLQIWAQEKLPHPKVAGEWTVERARQWIHRWQQRFADRSQLILAGKSLTELREGVSFAQRAGIKQIYLFTDTWRTDPFWPATDLNWAVNRAVFPRGETDLRKFSEFVRSRGMYLALHYVSGGIGLRDPVYVGQKPDRRFASWGAGRLACAASDTDTTLVFQPAAGVVPPAQHRPAYPSFFNWNMLRVGDELVRIGEIAVETDGTWTLKRCGRGAGSTTAATHPAGDECAGLLVAYGQNLVPDNNSTLLDEIATNYAGLLNRCVVEHVEFDGAEIHCHEGAWGYRKFATRIYEAIDHPTTAHDSSGRQPASWFEYRLNSSRRLMRGSCAYSHGNYSVPVTLATPSRPATTLLDAHFTLAQGNLGGALGINKPEPMFGVTPQTLKAHGLTEKFLAALATWKKVSALLTDEQRAQINASFSAPTGERARFNHHLCSPVVPVARPVGGRYEVVPTRVLTRRAGDIPWQHGQEHGAISPRQFIRPGETLALENPDAQQAIQFILHVLPAFDPSAEATAAANAKSAPVQKSSTDLFTDGNRATTPDVARSAGNILLQPPNAAAFHADGPTRALLEGNALVLTASNLTNRVQRETEALPWWSAAVDMTRRRGIGMSVTGDGSGALLLVELGQRDYVVPIDFTGQRYVEIPNGEVAWSSGAWGWRMETKSTDYSKVQRVKIGFGELPPGVQARVKVERLTALGELPVALQNPVLHVGSEQIRVRGIVASGHYLQYSGGSHAIVYDENWNQRSKLPVEPTRSLMPSGTVEVSVHVEQPGPLPWLETQFITTGKPIPVGVKRSE
jgi:hypothetical protein